MNDLSFLIYMADVLPSVSSFLAVVCITVGIITTILFFIGVTDNFQEANYEDDGKSPLNRDAIQAIRFRKLFPLAIFLWFLALLSYLVPSEKETYYAIAVSEVGEEIVKSETANKAMQALNNWLDRQLDNTEPPFETENKDDKETAYE